MSKKISVIVLLLMLSPLVLGNNSQTFYIAHKKTRLYSKANPFSDQINRLPYGLKVIIKQSVGNWVYIIEPVKGFVHREAMLDNDSFMRQADVAKNKSKHEVETKNGKALGFSDEDVLAAGVKGFSEEDEITAGSKAFSEEDEITAGSKAFSEEDEITAGSKAFSEEDEITAGSKAFSEKDEITAGSKAFSEKDEITTSSKAFNKNVEQKYKNQNNKIRYDLVDQIEVNGEIANAQKSFLKWRREGKLAEFADITEE